MVRGNSYEKEFTDIKMFWNLAPKRLKVFVKYSILNVGYRDAVWLRQHIWECKNMLFLVSAARI